MDPKADMAANPERQVARSVAVNVETIGMFEPLLIAIGRGIDEQQILPGLDLAGH